MSHPPSQAVIEAVERALIEDFGMEPCGMGSVGIDGYPIGTVWLRSNVAEVARAAEAAALKVAADECEANARDWYGTDIFRDVDSADLAAVRSAMQAKGKDIDNLSAWYFRRALTTRGAILSRMADVLTDTDDGRK